MFFESPRFPECIASGSKGGPTWLTDVVTVTSGHEQRNQRWQHTRHSYDVAFGVHIMRDLEQLIAFFHGVRGRAHGFRFKDYADYRSCTVTEEPTAFDQVIGTGDAAETSFQLTKTYDPFGTGPYYREIRKPVEGTVKIGVDGTEVPAVVDYTTGIVSFGTAPANGTSVTAGYYFDVPCRFDTDQLVVQLETILAGGAEIPIVEIRV